jgi:hypothetical protein
MAQRLAEGPEGGPLARAAATDPQASERLRDLIAARARLREPASPVEASPAPPPERPAPVSPAPDPPAELAPIGFRLLDRGPHVQVDLSLDALVALAQGGAVTASLRAPVLRRCPICARGGRTACGVCHGDGVVATDRMRSAPLDLERLAEGDMAIDAAPWTDAIGRAARSGPRLFARLV